jgi:hypothetical protein
MVGLDRRLNPPGADCRAHATKAMFHLSHVPSFLIGSHTGAGAAWRRDSSSPAMPTKRANAKVSRRSRDNGKEEAFIISEDHDSLISSNNDNDISDDDNAFGKIQPWRLSN